MLISLCACERQFQLLVSQDWILLCNPGGKRGKGQQRDDHQSSERARARRCHKPEFPISTLSFRKTICSRPLASRFKWSVFQPRSLTAGPATSGAVPLSPRHPLRLRTAKLLAENRKLIRARTTQRTPE